MKNSKANFKYQVNRNKRSKFETVRKIVRVKSKKLTRKVKSMTNEDWWNIFQMVGIGLVALTFTVAALGFVTGYKARQEKDKKAQETRERIEELKNNTAQLEKEVADAKTKQAEAEKALLELKERIQPRTLTAKQKNDFVQKLKAFPNGVIKFGYSSNDNNDGFDLTQQFLPLFKEAGWTVEGVLSNHLGLKVVGIGILIRGDEDAPAVSLTPNLLTLQSAFRSVGMEVQFINWDTDTPEVIVGSKP